MSELNNGSPVHTTTTTPTRPNLIVLKKEGDRTNIPEGGEMVCCKSYDDSKLYMKVEYSREMMMFLSNSILSTQRPVSFSEVMKEIPEVVANTIEFPVSSPTAVAPSPTSRRISILSQPLAGPITEVDKNVAVHHINHIMKPKFQEFGTNYSPSGFPLKKNNNNISYSPRTSPTNSIIDMPKFY